MTILDRWLRRTDHARRTKGDPPPTYQELEATVAEFTRKLAEAVAANASLHDRNERLHADLKAMRERLPMLTGIVSIESLDPDPTRPYIPTYEAGEGER